MLCQVQPQWFLSTSGDDLGNPQFYILGPLHSLAWLANHQPKRVKSRNQLDPKDHEGNMETKISCVALWTFIKKVFFIGNLFRHFSMIAKLYCDTEGEDEVSLM